MQKKNRPVTELRRKYKRESETCWRWWGREEGKGNEKKMEKEKQEMKGEGNWTAKWGGSKREGGEKRKGERVERKIREGQ